MRDYLPVSKISPAADNVRDGLGDLAELAASIRAQGIYQPLIVRRHPRLLGMYEIIDGHRRYEAARRAGAQRVPVTVVTGIVVPLVAMLVTACQRQDLSAAEKARAMGRLRDEHGYTQAQIASETGISQSAVSYYLTLLELDEGTQDRVAAGTVGVGEAMAAVRRTRARTARANGHKPRPKVTVSASHFSAAHHLAEPARIRCEQAGHQARKLGKNTKKAWPGACGACWEDEIRADERACQAESGAQC